MREGCNLRYADTADQWFVVPRRGNTKSVDLVSESAQKTLKKYVKQPYEHFQKEWKELELDVEHEFDLKAAMALLSKKTDDEDAEKANA